MIDTLVLSNGTLVPGNFLPVNGQTPVAVTYDGSNGSVYVATASGSIAVINATSGLVVADVSLANTAYDMAYDSANGYVYAGGLHGVLTVINGATNTVIGSISLGALPFSVAYDPANGYLFVATVASTVVVVNAATDAVVGSIQVGAIPDAIAYDSANGYLYAALNGSNCVAVINGATDAVVASIPVGSEPAAVAADGANGFVYVANHLSNNVTVIDGATDAVVASVPVGSGPAAVVVDSANGDVYAVNAASDNVTVISGAHDTPVGSVPVGNAPVSVALDSYTGDLYVANENSDNVTVVDGATDTTAGSVVVGTAPEGVAYDSANGEVYVANNLLNLVTVINGTTGALVGSVPVAWYPSAVAFDSANGYVYVTGSDNVTVINGATNAVVDKISVGVGPEGIAYDSSNGNLYVANLESENLTVIRGASDTVVGSIPIPGNPGWTYDGANVAFDSSNGYLYVTTGYSPNVTVVNGQSDTVVGSIPLHTILTAVAYDPANGYLYVGAYYGRNATVINGATGAVVGWVQTNGSPTAFAFDGANDFLYGTVYNSVTAIDGATSDVAGVSVNGPTPVGVDPVDLASDSANGYVYVTNEGSGSVSIIEPAALYTVSFEESGLPSGANWSVNVSGQYVATTSEAIVMALANGTYWYNASAPNLTAESKNMTWTAAGGSFTVDGAPTSVSVTFTEEAIYEVTFTESGLPPFIEWWVNNPGGRGAYGFGVAFGATITANLTNGTYLYSIGADARYAAPGGSFTVDGAPVSISVTFSPAVNGTAYSVTFTESGLPSGTGWSVDVGGVGSFSGTGVSIGAELANGTYAYSPGANNGWVAASGSFTVNGAAVSVSVTFSAPAPSSESVNVTVEPNLTFVPDGFVVTPGSPVQLNLTQDSTSSGTFTLLALANVTVPSNLTESQLLAYIQASGALVNLSFGPTPGEVYAVTFTAPSSGTYEYLDIDDFPSTTGVMSSRSSGVYGVTFVESGLPSGTAWWVNGTAIGSYRSTGSTRSVHEVNGTYGYTVGTADKEWAAPGGLYRVNGSSVSVAITFHLVSATVTFTESGLTTKAAERKLATYGWAVELNGVREASKTDAITFTGVANGTYPVLITGPSGIQAAGSGTVTVSSTTSVPVTMSVGRTGTVTFSERGLPKGQAWSVMLDGASATSTTGTAKFLNLTPGAYAYGVLSPLSGQNLTKKAGTSVTYGPTGTLALTGSATVVLTFAYRYAVTFTQSGLTSGSWSVTIKGVTVTRPYDDPIVFNETNGTYGYKVGTITGYTSSASPKSVVVPTGRSIAVTFTAKKGSSRAPTASVWLALMVAALVPASGRRTRGP